MFHRLFSYFLKAGPLSPRCLNDVAGTNSRKFPSIPKLHKSVFLLEQIRYFRLHVTVPGAKIRRLKQAFPIKNILDNQSLLTHLPFPHPSILSYFKEFQLSSYQKHLFFSSTFSPITPISLLQCTFKVSSSSYPQMLSSSSQRVNSNSLCSLHLPLSLYPSIPVRFVPHNLLSG